MNISDYSTKVKNLANALAFIGACESWIIIPQIVKL
jgi:hypothetical protein